MGKYLDPRADLTFKKVLSLHGQVVTDFGEVNEHYCHAILYMLLTAFGADVHIGEPLGRRMLVAGGTQEHHRMANGIMRIET